MSLVGALLLLVAAVVTSLRWLRVAQREHYLAWSVTRFEKRWLVARPLNLGLGVATAALILGGVAWPVLWIPAAAGLAVWPIGLGLRGHTSKLAWTRRLRTLAARHRCAGRAGRGHAAAGGRWPRRGGRWSPCSAAQLVDSAAWILGPIERRLLEPVRDHGPRPGWPRWPPTWWPSPAPTARPPPSSTSAALLAQQFEVCASPASYNNTAGLARTINEHLHPGTEILVAEMGMYDLGEIADLCAWIRPRVGVITAIGPVHLERLGTIERVVQAKREILDTAEVAVLNVDDPHLAALADEVAATHERDPLRRRPRPTWTWPCAARRAAAGGDRGRRPIGSTSPWRRGRT